MNDNGKTQGAGQKGPVRRRARLAAICAQIARTTTRRVREVLFAGCGAGVRHLLGLTRLGRTSMVVGAPPPEGLLWTGGMIEEQGDAPNSAPSA